MSKKETPKSGHRQNPKANNQMPPNISPKNSPNFQDHQNNPEKKGHKKVHLRVIKGGQKGPKKPVTPKSFVANLVSTILIFVIILLIYSSIHNEKNKDNHVSISELAQDIRDQKVESILVQGDDLEITYKVAPTVSSTAVSTSTTSTDTEEVAAIVKESKKEFGVGLSETLSNYGVTADELASTTIAIEDPTGFLYWLTILAPFLLPLIFIVILIWYLSRQVKGAGMQAFTFGQSRARITDPSNTKQKVTFKDVAGAKEAKQELSEIVDFLKFPKKFLEIGAQIPKGVLLMGSPGTGKTLLARAVAGEAGVPFFSISGSEFVEMFVGVGASRVRDLFKLAKASAPAIIFIDEIDAVGRARGVGVGGGNDEREQTLNQILVEMDGFEPNEKVIIMAATNRPDVLDPAILRPGRFDRRVTIDPPDRKDREEIMKIHARKKPLAEDVNFEIISQRTPGFSGADLYSLMNEAAILAAREDRKKISQFDLIRSVEKVMLGPERKSHIFSDKEKKITAYHEAGHAIVASVLPNADPVHKISIISRGRAGGYTLKLPTEERKLQSRKVFIDDLAMTLGGYVTEEMFFGDVTTGPSNDLQVATALAHDMVTRYGMSEEFGPIALEGDSGRAMFGNGVDDDRHSEVVSAKIDAEIKRLIDNAYNKAKEVVTENKKVLEIIAKRLLEVETLEREEYEQILVANGIAIESQNNKSDKTSAKA